MEADKVGFLFILLMGLAMITTSVFNSGFVLAKDDKSGSNHSGSGGDNNDDNNDKGSGDNGDGSSGSNDDKGSGDNGEVTSGQGMNENPAAANPPADDNKGQPEAIVTNPAEHQ